MFKKYLALVTTALISSLASTSVSAKEINLEQFFVFGDSLSDTGNVFTFSNNTFPPSPLYDEGRFSNGPIWIDYLSQDLGLNLNTFYGNNITELGDGLNFAVGGATTGTTSIAGAGFPGLTTQVDNFISLLNNETISDNSLITLWAGGNDYVENFLNNGTILNPAIPVNNIADSLSKLANAGAKNILIANLINLDDVPLSQTLLPPDQVAQLSVLTAVHNQALNSAVTSLEALFPETNLAIFDTNSVIENIVNNPANFGITANPTESCLNPNSFPNIDPNVVVCSNPDQYVYYDNQHFTSKIHGLIADAAVETIHQEFGKSVPESSNIAALIGLGLLFFKGVTRHN